MRTLKLIAVIAASFALGWAGHVGWVSFRGSSSEELNQQLSAMIKASLVGLADCPPRILEERIVIGCREFALSSSSAIEGRVDDLSIFQDRLNIRGWAADFRSAAPVALVIATIDGELKLWTQPGEDRQDVANHFRKPTLRFTGFRLVAPVPASFRTADHRIRLFAVSNQGDFTELKLP